jgi:hypothetical protein
MDVKEEEKRRLGLCAAEGKETRRAESSAAMQQRAPPTALTTRLHWLI